MANKRPLFSLKPTQEELAEGVKKYFDDNGGPGDGASLNQHIDDPTPHPAYDDLVAGRFVAHLQNGMA